MPAPVVVPTRPSICHDTIQTCGDHALIVEVSGSVTLLEFTVNGRQRAGAVSSSPSVVVSRKAGGVALGSGVAACFLPCTGDGGPTELAVADATGAVSVLRLSHGGVWGEVVLATVGVFRLGEPVVGLFSLAGGGAPAAGAEERGDLVPARAVALALTMRGRVAALSVGVPGGDRLARLQLAMMRRADGDPVVLGSSLEWLTPAPVPGDPPRQGTPGISDGLHPESSAGRGDGMHPEIPRRSGGAQPAALSSSDGSDSDNAPPDWTEEWMAPYDFLPRTLDGDLLATFLDLGKEEQTALAVEVGHGCSVLGLASLVATWQAQVSGVIPAL